ncbi:helix-turn-helix domain-containing protein [Metapseudomonas otitidis]|uniref:helix-turn-helix domain-containing protein n=1 Tax=Metapseudomonas otitidis TaxID=319939 RepID=UPI0013F598FA|nr:helix-turn-helix domain-containing protein [Pseudomonas otitidis]
MLAEVRSFDDSQQHAGSILGWNQVYDQMGRGSLSSELQQVAAERFQIFQETLDKRVVQYGCAPRGRLCIAMSLGVGRFPVVQGYEAGPQSVPLLRDGEEFLMHAPEGMSFFAINIDAERFARLAEVELSREQLGALRTQPQMAVSRAVLERVRSRVQPLFSALVKGDIALDRACEAHLEEQLLETFLDLFIHARDTPRERRGNVAVSAYLVRKCQEIALANTDELPSILALCEQLRVSRRTLQSSFQLVAGMRPVEYLRTLRLNAVRRRLTSTPASVLNVGEAAAEQGFYHLSHFSARYRELFGECPSETRRPPC